MVQRQQQTYSSRAWKQLRMLAYYQRYVTAYLKYLQQGKQGSGDPTIDELDSQLDEAVILLFRRMAHARLKELRAKASAADVKQPAQQQTWVGWLLGTGAKPAAQQAAPTDAAAGELDTSMGVEEWNKLEDVLAQQAVSVSRVSRVLCSVRELAVLGSFVVGLCWLPQQAQPWSRGSCRACSALTACCCCAAQVVRSVCVLSVCLCTAFPCRLRCQKMPASRPTASGLC